MNNPTVLPIMTTTSELLSECDRRGITVQLFGGGFKCQAPSGAMTAELHAALAASKDEVRSILQAEKRTEDVTDVTGSAEAHQSTAEPTSRLGSLADLILLLTPDDLPPTPFELTPCRLVVDRHRFLASLQSDIRLGASSPRYRSGVLQEDLQTVRDLLLKL